MPSPSLPPAPMMQQSINSSLSHSLNPRPLVRSSGMAQLHYDHDSDDEFQQSSRNQPTIKGFQPAFLINNQRIHQNQFIQPNKRQACNLMSVLTNQPINQSNYSISIPMTISPQSQTINSTASTASLTSIQSIHSNQSNNQSSHRSKKQFESRLNEPQHFKFSLDDIDAALSENDLEQLFDFDQSSIDSMSDESDYEYENDSQSESSSIKQRPRSLYLDADSDLDAEMENELDSPVTVFKPILAIITGATSDYEESSIQILTPAAQISFKQSIKKPIRKSKYPQHFTFSSQDLTQSLQTVSKELVVGHWSTFPKCNHPVIDRLALIALLADRQSRQMRAEILEFQENQAKAARAEQLKSMQSFVHNKLDQTVNKSNNLAIKAHPAVKSSQCVWSRAVHQAPKVAPAPVASATPQPQHRLVRSVSAVPYQMGQSRHELDSEVKHIPTSVSDPNSIVSTPSTRPLYYSQGSQSSDNSLFSPRSERKRQQVTHHRARTQQAAYHQDRYRNAQSTQVTAQYAAQQQAAYEMSLYHTWQAGQVQQHNQAKMFDQLAATMHLANRTQYFTGVAPQSSFQDAWYSTVRPNPTHSELKQNLPKQQRWSYHSNPCNELAYQTDNSTQLPGPQPHYSKQQPRVVSAPFTQFQ